MKKGLTVEGLVNMEDVPPEKRGEMLAATVAWNNVSMTVMVLKETGGLDDQLVHALHGMAIAASDLLLHMQKDNPDVVDDYIAMVRKAVRAKMTARKALVTSLPGIEDAIINAVREAVLGEKVEIKVGKKTDRYNL